MEELAKKYVGDAPLPPPSESFMLDGKDSEGVIMMADFKHDLNKFLESAQNTKIHSLADLIEFNKAHPDLEMPPGMSPSQLKTSLTFQATMTKDS